METELPECNVDIIKDNKHFASMLEVLLRFWHVFSYWIFILQGWNKNVWLLL